MRKALIACCVLALAAPGAADARALSFTVQGPAVLHIGSRSLHLPHRASRVELAGDRRGWALRVGERKARHFARRPRLRVDGGQVIDRLTGRGVVSLLGARQLARVVHPGWLLGRLARRGAWMRGMPTAALWRIGELHRRRRSAWWHKALAATLRLRGGERADTHDVGFVYGEGAAYGYDLGCRGARRAPFTRARCRALRVSASAAADRLAFMIGANAPARLLPNHVARCPDCPPGARETVIDSMMNVSLLTWAARDAGRAGYTRLALDHARAIAAVLIRPDGCTSQATFTDVASGRAFGVHTHQGLSAGSTWARGQGWAVLGFARLARDTSDPWALAVTRALAGCWLAKAPRHRLVRFDLDATGGPPDSSAQAAAAAGLATLALADRPQAPRWRAAARTQLAAAEKAVSTVPPLGRFGGQTYIAGGDRSDENTELPIAPLYDLEARARLDR